MSRPPSELEQLTRGVMMLEAHRYRFTPKSGLVDLVWLVPEGFLAGVDTAYGIPVQHVAGLESPHLAHRIEPFDMAAAQETA